MLAVLFFFVLNGKKMKPLKKCAGIGLVGIKHDTRQEILSHYKVIMTCYLLQFNFQVSLKVITHIHYRKFFITLPTSRAGEADYVVFAVSVGPCISQFVCPREIC